MTIEKLYEIMGLTFINSKVGTELANSNYNEKYKKAIDNLAASAAMLVEKINQGQPTDMESGVLNQEVADFKDKLRIVNDIANNENIIAIIDNNKTNVTDEQLEAFCGEYKKAWDNVNNNLRNLNDHVINNIDSASSEEVISTDVPKSNKISLQDFYAQMQLSFLNSEVCESLCKNEEGYKKQVDIVVKLAEKAVENINQGKSIDIVEHDMTEIAKNLKFLRLLTVGAQKSARILGNKYEAYKEEVEVANDYFSDCKEELLYNVYNQDNELEEDSVSDNIEDENEALKVAEQPVEQPKPVAQPKVAPVQQPKPVAQPKPVPKDTTVGAFDAIIEKLDKARTFSNSDEYDDLIKLVKFANKHDSWEKGENFTKKQSYVLLLRGIQSAITRYVKHKGEKGVKQNAYKKLAAVEELNADITNRLKEVTFEPFNYGKDTINKRDLVITYEQEKLMYDVNEFKRPGMKVPEPIEKGILEKHIEKLQSKGFYKKATAEELGNVDKCMCRIILSAMGNKEVETSDVADLVDMRKEFWANPGKDIEKIKVEEPVNTGRRI